MPSLRLAVIAAMLGLTIVAGETRAASQPAEPPANSSFQSAVDGFVSYLKAETNELATVAMRLARENKDIAEAKSRIDTQFSAWSAALSHQKARLSTLSRDASAKLQAWSEAAISSWAKLERSARETLDWITARMRNQSSANPKTPV
jgi:hypothetical protein